jgi:hypothetical protein
VQDGAHRSVGGPGLADAHRPQPSRDRASGARHARPRGRHAQFGNAGGAVRAGVRRGRPASNVAAASSNSFSRCRCASRALGLRLHDGHSRCVAARGRYRAPQGQRRDWKSGFGWRTVRIVDTSNAARIPWSGRAAFVCSGVAQRLGDDFRPQPQCALEVTG